MQHVKCENRTQEIDDDEQPAVGGIAKKVVREYQDRLVGEERENTAVVAPWIYFRVTMDSIEVQQRERVVENDNQY